MFRYRLHTSGGDDLGDATYAVPIRPGDEIHVAGGERLRVVAVLPFEREGDGPPLAGMLEVEVA
jgi:hypothetical protein